MTLHTLCFFSGCSTGTNMISGEVTVQHKNELPEVLSWSEIYPNSSTSNLSARFSPLTWESLGAKPSFLDTFSIQSFNPFFHNDSWFNHCFHAHVALFMLQLAVCSFGCSKTTMLHHFSWRTQQILPFLWMPQSRDFLV